ncbi:erythromycin esterase family protein [Actinoplanes friuliensis]|uniref:Erythromycin esterase type II n=1 Tax=Actinoplanes friuliensis DSM 7358 TaxID=1246995 RepID=U5W5I5_9ACTN|nr:erythromycin esterase family protein [Actinoplanes friuliensis]AGZ43245.1 Erythromycin esterase type II [Actinoplanes friuliensis DSM 7358]
MAVNFGAFVTGHSVPLDDLEPLADLFRGARVVAIGENAHMISEFYLFRHRLLRFLTERCGFTVFAMESGFSEGLAVDAWVRGGPGDVRAVADDHITYRMGRCPEMREQLEWMREAKPPVRFAGLDVPGNTASPLPAIEHVAGFLGRTDPDALPLVDALSARMQKYAGEHSMPAYRAYAELDPADRDAMTAALAELAARFDALETEYTRADGAATYRTVRHELRLACWLDQALRSYAARAGGDTSHPKVSARDRGMAETVFWLLDELGPDARIVIGAHNNHIQRTPVTTPQFALSGMGHHLATRLGEDYLTVAVTATAGRTVTHRLDPAAPGGVATVGAELPPPQPGSVEAAFTGTDTARLIDLRRARGLVPGPDSIRLLDGFQATPVLDAYDLLACLPTINPSEQAGGA